MQRSDDSGDRDESDTQPEHGADRAPDRWLNRAALTRRGALIGMTAVAGIAAVDVGGFAFAGGWLRPDALTPSRFADGFEQVYGRHDGFGATMPRASAPAEPSQSNGAGIAVCEAAVFNAGHGSADRPVFAFRWTARSARQTRHGPRPGAAVPATGRPTVAHRDGQHPGFPRQHPAGFLRATARSQAGCPRPASPTRSRWPRFWPAIPRPPQR